MKKLQIKTKISKTSALLSHLGKSLRQDLKYFIVGLIFIVASVGGLLYYSQHRAKATGGFDYVSRIPAQSYTLISPQAIASDSSGYLYLYSGDLGVVKFDPDGNYLGTIVAYSQAQDSVNGMAVDGNGNIYVSQFGGLVKKFLANGSFSTEWHIDGYDDGNLNDIQGIAVDSQNNVYVSDRYRAYIQVFDSSGNFQYKWSSPGVMGIAIDSQDKVYAIDNGNKMVRKYDTAGSPDITWGSYGSGNGQFTYPTEIFTDPSGGVYVVDEYYRLQKFSNTGTYQLTWGGYSATPQPGKFGGRYIGSTGYSQIWGMANANGVFLTDWYGYRVQKFNFLGEYQAQYGDMAPGQFNRPAGIALDADNNVYVVDQYNFRVQKFDSNNNFITQWGTRGTGDGEFGGDFGSFYNLAIDKNNGYVYVMDEPNYRVEKFDLNGNYLSQFGSPGTGLGQFNDSISSGPNSIAVDQSGNVFVSDHQRIQKFAPDNSVTAFTTPSGVQSIATDNSGNIYASTSSRIYKYNSSGVLQYSFAISLYGSSNDWPGYPANMTVDQYGDIYLVNNFVVQKIKNNGQYIAHWGGQGTANGQFTSPSGIAVTDSGKIYVSDQMVNGTPGTYNVQIFQDNTMLTINTNSLASGTVGSPYSQTISTSYNHGTVSFSITAGSLPDGLTLDPQTGAISGTPTTAGDSYFTLTAQDSLYTASKNLMISVTAAADPLPSVTTLPATNIDLEVATLNGSTTAPETIAQQGFQYGPTESYGQVVYDATNVGTSNISTTITGLTCGTNYHFQAFAINNTGIGYGADQVFATSDCPTSNIELLTTSLPDGRVGDVYSHTLESQNANGSPNYLITAGSLPSGLTLNSGTGVISGTPTEEGDYPLTISVSDNYGADSKQMTLHVEPLTNPLEITTASLPNGRVGTDYTAQIETRYAVGDVTYSISSGSLPLGLSISSTTGDIYGTPTVAGSSSFTVSAVDTYSTATHNYTVLISASGGGTGGGGGGGGTTPDDNSNPYVPPVTVEQTKAIKKKAKDKEAALQVEAIAENNAKVADVLEAAYKKTGILPNQIIYGLPWLVVLAFSIFTAISFKQTLDQARYFKELQARQTIHKQLIDEKRTFVSLASHYFRTPVAIVRGGTELAAKSLGAAAQKLTELTNKLDQVVNKIIGEIDDITKK